MITITNYKHLNKHHKKVTKSQGRPNTPRWLSLGWRFAYWSTRIRTKCIVTLTALCRRRSSSSDSDAWPMLSWFSSSTALLTQPISESMSQTNWLWCLSRSSASACSNAASFHASSNWCSSSVWRVATSDTGSLSVPNNAARFAFDVAMITSCSANSLCKKDRHKST